MVSATDEPIALSKAIQGMIKSVNTGNRLTQENNKDLIAGLSSLKTTIQQAFLGLKNTTKGQVATVNRDEGGINSPSALLRNINTSILIQNQLLTKYLSDVPFLTSATARHETFLFRQNLIDQIKRLASGGGGGFGFGGGIPQMPKGAVAAAEDVAEGALGVGGIELEQSLRKPGVLKRLLLKGGGFASGALSGGARLAVGAGGGLLAYNGLSKLNSGAQSQPFFGGKNGIVGSTASNYAQSIAGGAMMGASIGGPWGALIGGGVGLSAALYREFQPQIDDFLGSTFTKVKGLTGGVMDWFGKNLPSWDEIKQKVNAVGFDVGSFATKINKWVNGVDKGINDWMAKTFPNLNKSLNTFQVDAETGNFNDILTRFTSEVKAVNSSINAMLTSVDNFGKKNIPGYTSFMATAKPTPTSPGGLNPYGDPTSIYKQLNGDKTNDDAGSSNDKILTKVLSGLLGWLTGSSLKAMQGYGNNANYSLSSYNGGGYQNQTIGFTNAAYTTGGSSGGDGPIQYNPWAYGGNNGGLTNSGSVTPNSITASIPGYSVPGGNNTSYSNTSLPRPVRNNNPFDLKYFKGQVGLQPGHEKDGPFGVYTSMQAGVAAAAHQLLLHPDVNTVNSIENRYGPPSENNTGGDIKRLSAYLGSHGLSSNPNAKLDLNDPKVMSILIGGLAQIEMGAKLQSQYVPMSTINSGVALAERGSLTHDTDSTTVANNKAPSQANLAPAERPKPQTPTAATAAPSPYSMITPASFNSGAGSPPSSNAIPMHITAQGLILVNHPTVTGI